MTHPLNQVVADFLAPILEKTADDILKNLEIPSDAKKGDRALPCFKWSKEYKKSPQALADAWKSAIDARALPIEIEKVESVAGYLNFFAKTDLLAKSTLTAILNEPNYGFVTEVHAKKVIVEFSSPNIAKPFSIGHLRSTNIGACLARIFAARGYDVVKINHLGDWGTQFGKLMSAYRRWGKAEDLSTSPMDALFKLYVKFHEQEVSDPTLIDEAREWFSKLEKGDPDAKELWEWFREITLREMEVIYGRLGVSFDHYWGESFYIHLLSKLMAELKQKNITQESEDAIIINLEDHGLHTALVQKKDESSLYISRDLAAAIYRKDKIHFDHMIYVVGTPQQLHFQQLFKVLNLMGHEWSSTCEHVMFGHISFGDQSMSTRKGNVVFLKDVLDKAVELAMTVVNEKNPDLENKEVVAEQIALGAILYADLSARRIKDIKFNWEDILNFEGETGPYMQYSFVRMKSLIEKFGRTDYVTFDGAKLSSDEEGALVRMLSLFPSYLEKAEHEREPFVVAHYLMDLSQKFNKFYAHHRILDADEGEKLARMALVVATSKILESGMKLIGIPTPDKM